MKAPLRLPLALPALALALGLAGCAPDGTRRTLRLGHGLDPSHPVHRAMEHLAQRLGQLSGGRLGIAIHPSEQLGSERECLELLQIGSLAMTKVSSSVLENFAPGFAVFGVPYLFRDEAHRWAVLEGPIGRALLREARGQRLLGLAFYDAGRRSFYTRDRPVRTPDDLRGLKIRTQESPMAMALVGRLGGTATPLAWGELYTALQQGVVDGAENNPPSFHLSGHYEVARHYSLDAHTAPPDVLLIGTAVWEGLSARERGWLEAAAAASGVRQRQLWREATAEALRAVRAAGVQVLRPDVAAFAARSDGLAEQVLPPHLLERVRRIREVRP